MSDRRYVVAYGDFLHREVGRAPDAESGDFLTKAEAARRIVSEMNAAIGNGPCQPPSCNADFEIRAQEGSWPMSMTPQEWLSREIANLDTIKALQRENAELRTNLSDTRDVATKYRMRAEDLSRQLAEARAEVGAS